MRVATISNGPMTEVVIEVSWSSVRRGGGDDFNGGGYEGGDAAAVKEFRGRFWASSNAKRMRLSTAGREAAVCGWDGRLA